MLELSTHAISLEDTLRCYYKRLARTVNLLYSIDVVIYTGIVDIITTSMTSEFVAKTANQNADKRRSISNGSQTFISQLAFISQLIN